MKPHPNKKQWNIIFLIYAELADQATIDDYPGDYDGADVRGDLNRLKKTIRNISLKNNFNVFTIENIVQIKKNPVTGAPSITGDHTYIKKLVFDDVKKKNRQDTRWTLKRTDFAQKGPDIAGVFRHIDQNYPADKNLLVTWDHGSAFGIFKKTLTDPPPMAPVVPSPPITGSPITTPDETATVAHAAPQAAVSLFSLNKNITFPVNSGNFRILSQKVTGNGGIITTLRTNLYEMLNSSPSFEEFVTQEEKEARSSDFALLSNDSLAAAITNGFSNKCVDVLLMFNCDMQNMHTCYSLRDAVRYLVAPEGEMAGPGYDYIAITNLIGKNDAIGAREVSAKAVDTFKQNYKGKYKDIVDSIAIFAVDLKEYNHTIIEPLNDFSSKMEDMMNGQHSLAGHLVDIRKNSYAFGMGRPMDYYMVDLINFMQDASDGTNNQELKNLKQTLRAACKSIVIDSVKGKHVYLDVNQPNTAEYKKHRKPTGLTIYFPALLQDPREPISRNFLTPGAPFSSSLLKDTKWVGFLYKLFTTKNTTQ